MSLSDRWWCLCGHIEADKRGEADDQSGASGSLGDRGLSRLLRAWEKLAETSTVLVHRALPSTAFAGMGQTEGFPVLARESDAPRQLPGMCGRAFLRGARSRLGVAERSLSVLRRAARAVST